MKIQSGFTCQLCGRRGVELHVHHLDSWDFFPEERYEESNLIVLCRQHHEGFHDIYQYGKNTHLQFAEYKEMVEMLIKLAEKEVDKAIRVKTLVNLCFSDGYSDGYTA